MQIPSYSFSLPVGLLWLHCFFVKYMYDYKYILDEFPNYVTRFFFIISGSSWKIFMLHIIIPVIPGGFFRKNIEH